MMIITAEINGFKTPQWISTTTAKSLFIIVEAKTNVLICCKAWSIPVSVFERSNPFQATIVDFDYLICIRRFTRTFWGSINFFTNIKKYKKCDKTWPKIYILLWKTTLQIPYAFVLRSIDHSNLRTSPWILVTSAFSLSSTSTESPSTGGAVESAIVVLVAEI